ncbi:MAG: DPP IV N-terminal domain-containing protein [Rubripirellula sp.]
MKFATLHLTRIASLAFLIIAPAIPRGFAQSWIDRSWEPSAQERLEQIYERETFRATSLQPSWSGDGSKLRIRRPNSETGQNSWQWLLTETGQPTTPPERPNETKRDSDVPETVTGDGEKTKENQLPAYRHEIRDGNLVVLHNRGADIRSSEPVLVLSGEEGKRFYGMTWSTDGQHLALIQSDMSDVRKRSMLVPSDPSYPGIEERHFARVGETIATLKVGLVDPASKSITWVDLDPVTSNGQQGFYLGQVQWAPGGNELLIEKMSRFRERRQFLLVTPESETNNEQQSSSQQIKTIFDETNYAWAISSQGKNLGLIWLEGGSKFIVISEKDGWRHAFLYSREGEELATLTPGNYDIIDRGPVDETAGWFYFYASPENGTQKHLYRVSLGGDGKLQRITPDELPGTNDYNFAPKLDFALHTHSTIDSPPVVSLVSLPDHKVIKVLDDNDAVRETMSKWNVNRTEFVKIETESNVSMDALVMKPRNFDTSKKHPVLVYVYGEPHGQTVLDQWAAGQSLFHRVISDLGYIVVSIDNRGTPAPKGAAWRRAVFGSLGPLSTEDQADAIQKLGTMKPYIDLDRVAIWGWSGGGSNTLNALFRKPDVYQVGIAVVPKPQPHLYNAWFQEIYMRTREVNAEGYQKSAPLHFAEGLRGKLLMVTGSGETNTHIQIIEGLVDRLVELGKPFDYMVYPNRNHGLSEGPGSRVHVRMLIARYLVENLPREAR